MSGVWIAASIMLVLAAGTTMFRLLAGPSTLDRLVALDTLIAVTMCGVGTWAAFSLDTTVTYSLVALALISFVGSVSIARFRVRDAQRLAVDRGAVTEWGSVLDAQVARIDRTVAALTGRHPDYWKYHLALEEVSQYVSTIVTRIRQQAAAR